MASRSRSAWPLWRAVSSIMWSITHRRLNVSPVRCSPAADRVEVAEAGDGRPAALAGRVVQGEQVLRFVVDGRVEVPVGVGVPVDAGPRLGEGLAEHHAAEPRVLHQGEVLDQRAQRQVGGGGGLVELGLVEARRLHHQRGPVVVEELAEQGRLGAQRVGVGALHGGRMLPSAGARGQRLTGRACARSPTTASTGGGGTGRRATRPRRPGGWCGSRRRAATPWAPASPTGSATAPAGGGRPPTRPRSRGRSRGYRARATPTAASTPPGRTRAAIAASPGPVPTWWRVVTVATASNDRGGNGGASRSPST